MVSSARASIAHLHDPQSMLYPLLRPLLFALDPETAHEATFASLDIAERFGVAGLATPPVPPSPVTVMGLRFPTASAWPPGSTRTPRTSTASRPWVSASSNAGPSRPGRNQGIPNRECFA
jgi:hypothetical protein